MGLGKSGVCFNSRVWLGASHEFGFGFGLGLATSLASGLAWPSHEFGFGFGLVPPLVSFKGLGLAQS